MPVINTHQNIAAFLDMLAVSEGTANHPLTKNRGYDVIVTGLDGKPEIFTDYSDHPFAHGRQFCRRLGDSGDGYLCGCRWCRRVCH